MECGLTDYNVSGQQINITDRRVCPYLVLDGQWNIWNLHHFLFPMIVPVIGTHATNGMHALFLPTCVVLTHSGLFGNIVRQVDLEGLISPISLNCLINSEANNLLKGRHDDPGC